ncbi:MAG: hypothetical protein J5903_00835 [Clostridia bacterium]|nr:hypothetical protein [Clostridia bacterium]
MKGFAPFDNGVKLNKGSQNLAILNKSCIEVLLSHYHAGVANSRSVGCSVTL